MKKKILITMGLLSLIFIIVLIRATYVQAFFDSFEDGVSWTLWTETSGTGWANVAGCPTTCGAGTQCACAESGATDVLAMTTAVDLTSYVDCILTYQTIADASLDAGEFLKVNVTNSGGAWVNIYSCTNGEACENNAWTSQTYNITSGVGLNNNFKVQVGAILNDANEEVGIDNIAVTCDNGLTDTCTYGGSGNWAINCADNCVFTTQQTINNGNNVTATGTGNLTFNSGGKWVFTGTNQNVVVNSGCTLVINSGGGFGI